MHPSEGVSKIAVDPALLRRALGSFVTGVTVVTTRNGGGKPIGLTVNSFNAVSLEPPLVLWSLSLRAASFDAFVQASHFAVNVLAADQAALSETFAKTGGDKFANVAWASGIEDMPLLEGVAASFTCSGCSAAHQQTRPAPTVLASRPASPLVVIARMYVESGKRVRLCR